MIGDDRSATDQRARAFRAGSVFAVSMGAVVFGIFGAFLGYFISVFPPLHTAAVTDAFAAMGLARPDLTWVGAALGALSSAVCDWVIHRTSSQDASSGDALGMRVLASDLGAQYFPSGGELEYAFRSFFIWGVRCANVIWIDSGGARIAIAETLRANRGGRLALMSMLMTTPIVAFLEPGNMKLPTFTLQPQGLFARFLSFVKQIELIHFPARPEFSSANCLTAADPQCVQRLFDDRVLEALSGTHGLFIRSSPRGILLFRRGRQPNRETLDAFVKEASAILSHLWRAAKLAAEFPSKTSDGKEMAKNMPDWRAKFLRRNIVTRADVEDFLALPIPRAIPANIRRQYARTRSIRVATGGFSLLIGSTLAWMVWQKAGGAGGMKAMQLTGLAIAAAFLGLGIASMCQGIRDWIRIRRVLRRGHVGSARILDITPLASGFEGQRYRMRVIYRATNTDTQAFCTIRGDARERARKQKLGHKLATILFDPQDPRRVLYTDSLLRGSPEIER